MQFLQGAVRPIAIVYACALSSMLGCRGVVAAYGGDAVTARANADAVAWAMEQRFTNVTRAPKFASARSRLGRYAFAPSKLVNDTALWTSSGATPSGVERSLELSGSLMPSGYAFLARPNVAAPTKAGDERHLIRLTQLGGDDWRWSTEVDQAIGGLPPARVNAVARALFAAAERPSATVRADYRSAFPRTADALGRLLTLDSVHAVAQSDGSTLMTMHVLTRSSGIKADFPAFAKYIDKYVVPSRYRFRLSDRAGGDWFDAQSAGGRLIVRFRTHRGELQPLVGPARRMPDSLLLNVDALAKIGFFTVGVTSMQGDFVHVATPAERGWVMRFTKEPEWHLPLIAERLLRSPLKRPFQQGGMDFRLQLRSASDGNTVLGRLFTVAVRESAIMRFIGNLGFTAMSDYAGSVEEQENRFIAETFRAMRADMSAQ